MSPTEKDALCEVLHLWSGLPEPLAERVLWGTEPTMWDRMTLNDMTRAAQAVIGIIKRIKERRG